jgi:hypothetical protein
MTGATVITMIGDTITQEPADEHFARIACEKHVQTLRRLSLSERRAYMVTVEQKEGSQAYYRLKAAYVSDWERRTGDCA